MIKLENMEISGFKPAIRGMRNSWNSWDKSDSQYNCPYKQDLPKEERNTLIPYCLEDLKNYYGSCIENMSIGQNDQELMTKLAKSGSDHRKFMRMIIVYVDITAPLYWWKEFDTYKVGTVANSCSTMHKIHDKEFTLEDFSTDHITDSEGTQILLDIIDFLNGCRMRHNVENDYAIKKIHWWNMIQLLPSSYNQRRTVMLNYEVLMNIYNSRKNHKLDEWKEFCNWIETLPCMKDLLGITDREEFEKNFIRPGDTVKIIDHPIFKGLEAIVTSCNYEDQELVDLLVDIVIPDDRYVVLDLIQKTGWFTLDEYRDLELKGYSVEKVKSGNLYDVKRERQEDADEFDHR